MKKSTFWKNLENAPLVIGIFLLVIWVLYSKDVLIMFLAITLLLVYIFMEFCNNNYIKSLGIEKNKLEFEDD